MTQDEILKEFKFFKERPYQKTNIEGIDICYEDRKYVRMDPKSSVTVSPGFMYLIIKKPKQWVAQYIKIEEEVTLVNETRKYMYYTLQDSVFDTGEKEFKLHIKSGIDPDEIKD